MRGLLVVLAIVIGSLGVHGTVDAEPADQTADEVVAVIQEAAGRRGADSSQLTRIAFCESRYYRYAVGAAGEQGLFQLHPQGLRRTFYARGYTDVWSIEEQADFAAWAMTNGLRSHWAC